MKRYWGERLAGAGFILLAVYFSIIALEFPAGGGIFPLFTATCAVFLSVMLILDTVFRRGADLDEAVDFSISYTRLKPLLLTCLVVVYVLSIFVTGYFTASLLFLVIATIMIGIRGVRIIAITAVILFPLMYLFFETFLRANLPQGFLI